MTGRIPLLLEAVIFAAWVLTVTPPSRKKLRPRDSVETRAANRPDSELRAYEEAESPRLREQRPAVTTPKARVCRVRFNSPHSPVRSDSYHATVGPIHSDGMRRGGP